MKKFLSLLLVLMLALSLVACGEQGEQSGQGTDKISACFVTDMLGDNSFADAADRSQLKMKKIYRPAH